jgi:hypothetical protein
MFGLTLSFLFFLFPDTFEYTTPTRSVTIRNYVPCWPCDPVKGVEEGEDALAHDDLWQIGFLFSSLLFSSLLFMYSHTFAPSSFPPPQDYEDTPFLRCGVGKKLPACVQASMR